MIATWQVILGETRPVLTSSASMRAQRLSCFWLFAPPWTITHQAYLSMAFHKQECSTGLPFPPPPGDLPDPGIEPPSPVSHVLAGGFFTMEPPRKPFKCFTSFKTVTFGWGNIKISCVHLSTNGQCYFNYTPFFSYYFQLTPRYHMILFINI